MKYRKMGSLDWNVSALGFGAMRLPMIDQSTVNEEEAIKMIRYAIDNGVNYIDTAYPYHNGKSEAIVGKALQEGYRKKVYLTTKLPMWSVKEKKDFHKFLSEQIDRLQTTPDIYLFHGLNKNRFEKIKNLGLVKEMEIARENGLFKYFGFSFHDKFDVFKEIIDYYKWDCCQIQFNYLDVNYQAGTKGLKYAGSKGIAVIVMEPIRGGKLAIPVHKLDTRPEIKKILDNSKVKRTMADWALQFVWNHPEVSVVLSGMSSMQQVKENIISAESSGVNSLKKKELTTISELRKSFNKYIVVPCTSCEYCLPCPNGVAIPMVIRLLNELAYWGELGRPRISLFYSNLIKTQKELNEKLNNGDEAEGAANLCIQCGECLDKCPQQIDIPNIMKKTASIFEEDKKVADYF